MVHKQVFVLIKNGAHKKAHGRSTHMTIYNMAPFFTKSNTSSYWVLSQKRGLACLNGFPPPPQKKKTIWDLKNSSQTRKTQIPIL